MSSEKKAMELQFQVRQNARELQSSVKELHSWEKDIKAKEQAMLNAPAPTISNTPVRSHATKASETGKSPTSNKQEKSVNSSPGGSIAGTPTEKQDLPLDAVAQKHKKANDIKDRGNNYVKQADYEKAIEAYTEAIEVYSQDPVYYINRALCYLKRECHDKCVEDCELAIALDSLCVKAYYRRMQANESLGNNMEALKDCTTVLGIDPKNMEAKRSLERINNRLRQIASKNGPNFNSFRSDLIDISSFNKPAYKRSKEPMRRVPVVDIVSSKASKDAPKPFHISDEEIDKIFNGHCGYYEEIKKEKPSFRKKLDMKTQTKQPASQPKVDINVKATGKPVEIVSNVKLKDSPEIIKSLGETVDTAEKPTIKVLNTDKSAKAVKKTVETAQSSILSESQVRKTVTNSMERVPESPAGTAQFYITWKELSPTQKYQYLKSIEVVNLCKILGAGFDSDTFADLLRTLNDFYIPNKEPTTAAVLFEISKNDEFTILAMLMSKEEKQMIASIMQGIKQFPKSNVPLLEKLSKIYNIA